MVEILIKTQYPFHYQLEGYKQNTFLSFLFFIPLKGVLK